MITKSEVAYRGDDYQPVVEYTYEVDGVTYSGNTVARGLITFNWNGPAKRIVARFPVGTKVTVFIDPTNPRRAALQQNVDRNLPTFVLVFTGLLVLFVFLIVFGRAA